MTSSGSVVAVVVRCLSTTHRWSRRDALLLARGLAGQRSEQVLIKMWQLLEMLACRKQRLFSSVDCNIQFSISFHTLSIQSQSFKKNVFPSNIYDSAGCSFFYILLLAERFQTIH